MLIYMMMNDDSPPIISRWSFNGDFDHDDYDYFDEFDDFHKCLTWMNFLAGSLANSFTTDSMMYCKVNHSIITEGGKI